MDFNLWRFPLSQWLQETLRRWLSTVETYSFCLSAFVSCHVVFQKGQGTISFPKSLLDATYIKSRICTECTVQQNLSFEEPMSQPPCWSAAPNQKCNQMSSSTPAVLPGFNPPGALGTLSKDQLPLLTALENSNKANTMDKQNQGTKTGKNQKPQPKKTKNRQTNNKSTNFWKKKYERKGSQFLRPPQNQSPKPRAQVLVGLAVLATALRVADQGVAHLQRRRGFLPQKVREKRSV